MRAAEEVDADAYPTAAAHLKFARDQIEAALKYIEEDDSEENAAAARILERAELDAEVAVQRAGWARVSSLRAKLGARQRGAGRLRSRRDIDLR